MAEEGTAVLAEPDNGTELIEATPPEAVTEAADEQVAESGDSGETTETEPEPSRWAGKSDEEIEAAIEAARKDAHARSEESHRQRLENARVEAEAQAAERAWLEQRQETEQFMAGKGVAQLQNLVTAYEEGKITPAQLPQALNYLAGQLTSVAVSSAIDQSVQFMNDYLAKTPDFKVPGELVQQFNRAMTSRNVRGMEAAKLEILKAQVRESLTAEIRKEIEAEAREKAKSAQKVQQARSADTARASEARPTVGVGSGTPRGRMTLAEIDAMPTNQWLAMPKEERDRLLTEARRA